MAAAALMALTYATFDATAFHQPTYTGALRAAPWAIALAQEGLAKARRLGEQMAVVATNLSELFERIERIEPAGVAGADATVLVVSDIHNNPVAMDLVDNVVATFRPSFVLDAGDLTDYGTAFEARGVIRLGSLGLPYAFAPGNHDSPTLLAQLRRLPNVVAFETPRVVTLADVPVLGGPDPSSRRPTPALPTDEELQAQVAGMAEAMAHAHIPPVIAVAHNPQVARAFVGTVPVVVTGHTHRLDVHQEAGTVWINPGTTGAAGLRGLQAPEEVPYTLVLLYLDRTDDGWRVLATDLISLRNVQGTMVLERRAFGVAQPEEGSEGGSGLHRSAG
ncbi:MAG: metallophosphatase family protein [Clostridia bacterium]|nr:metallophosphatase family protein [Clostridia bacterium]